MGYSPHLNINTTRPCSLCVCVFAVECFCIRLISSLVCAVYIPHPKQWLSTNLRTFFPQWERRLVRRDNPLKFIMPKHPFNLPDRSGSPIKTIIYSHLVVRVVGWVIGRRHSEGLLKGPNLRLKTRALGDIIFPLSLHCSVPPSSLWHHSTLNKVANEAEEERIFAR